MSRRSLETLTDILVLVVSPVLVMILVASLAFFLIQCLYEGQFFGRLNFATGLFVIAAVLVARIAIEEGREYASGFALPLGVVTILSILQYTDLGALFAVPLVLFLWWSTDKLTWDCTVLDEQKDASGEGLLQTIGLDEKSEDMDADATTDRERTEATSIWHRWISRRRRHHTPGVWVIYFGLAAIPLFGIGQSLLPSGANGAGFLLLCTYVASALALLMITSFLQMRRYLLQRRLPFTEKMAATWLGTGGIVIIALMLFCLVLPRPNTGYSLVDSLSTSIDKTSSRDDRDASENGMGREGQRDSEQDGSGQSDQSADTDSNRGSQASDEASQGRTHGKQGDDADTEQTGDQQGKGDQPNQPSNNDNRSPGHEQHEEEPKAGETDKSDSQSRRESESNKPKPNSQEQELENQQQPDDPPASSRPRFQPPKLSNPLQNLTLPPIPKLVYILLVGIGILAALYFFGRQVLAAISAFLRDLLALFRRLFGGSNVAETVEVEEATQLPAPPPFRSFKDPFATGMASRLSPQQLVAYTFDALQAWASEQHCARHDDQTPLEFAIQISDTNSAIGPHARNLAVLYNQAAYAPNSLGANAVEHIQALWNALRKTPSQP